MYRIQAIFEVDSALPEQADTVKRKLVQMFKAAFEKAPYDIRGRVSEPLKVEVKADPEQGRIIIP